MAARPVRTVDSLRRKSSMTVSMRGLVSLITSFSLMTYSSKFRVSSSVSRQAVQSTSFSLRSRRDHNLKVELCTASRNSELGTRNPELFIYRHPRADTCLAGKNANDIARLAHVKD